jgi:hypothetical protein
MNRRAEVTAIDPPPARTRGVIRAGVNKIKIAIADAGNHVVGSDVMIRRQSFQCGASPRRELAASGTGITR